MDNPRGFEVYRAAIDEIAMDLGGTLHIRQAVSDEAQEFLFTYMRRLRGMNTWAHVELSEASNAELEAAALLVTRHFLAPPHDASSLIAEAGYGSACLELRESEVHLVGTKYRFRVASHMTEPSFDWRANKNVTKWMISVSRNGLLIATGSSYGTGGPSTTHAKSAVGAHASLRGIVERFFKVSFTNNADAGRARIA